MSKEASKKQIKCPQCRTLCWYSEANPYRPFCSHRCQLIDLGEWASEKYSVPSQEDQPSEDDLIDAENKGDLH